MDTGAVVIGSLERMSRVTCHLGVYYPDSSDSMDQWTHPEIVRRIARRFVLVLAP